MVIYSENNTYYTEHMNRDQYSANKRTFSTEFLTYSKALVLSKALNILSKLPLRGRSKVFSTGEESGAHEERFPMAIGPHRYAMPMALFWNKKKPLLRYLHAKYSQF